MKSKDVSTIWGFLENELGDLENQLVSIIAKY